LQVSEDFGLVVTSDAAAGEDPGASVTVDEGEWGEFGGAADEDDWGDFSSRIPESFEGPGTLEGGSTAARVGVVGALEGAVDKPLTAQGDENGWGGEFGDFAEAVPASTDAGGNQEVFAAGGGEDDDFGDFESAGLGPSEASVGLGPAPAIATLALDSPPAAGEILPSEPTLVIAVGEARREEGGQGAGADALVDQLVAIGFERARAVRAARACPGDMGAATDWLLDSMGEANVETTPPGVPVAAQWHGEMEAAARAQSHDSDAFGQLEGYDAGGGAAGDGCNPGVALSIAPSAPAAEENADTEQDPWADLLAADGLSGGVSGADGTGAGTMSADAFSESVGEVGAVAAADGLEATGAGAGVLSKGEEVWYRDRDGQLVRAEIVSLDQSLQPPSYLIHVLAGASAGAHKETERHRSPPTRLCPRPGAPGC